MDEASSPLRRIALGALMPVAALAVIPLVLGLAVAFYLRAFVVALWCIARSLVPVPSRSAAPALRPPHFPERASIAREQDIKANGS